MVIFYIVVSLVHLKGIESLLEHSEKWDQCLKTRVASSEAARFVKVAHPALMGTNILCWGHMTHFSPLTVASSLSCLRYVHSADKKKQCKVAAPCCRNLEKGVWGITVLTLIKYRLINYRLAPILWQWLAPVSILTVLWGVNCKSLFCSHMVLTWSL